MYSVIIENNAYKELESLPNQIIQSIIESIEALKLHPRPKGVKKLLGRDGWRVRVGQYRILYTISDREKMVTIYRIKHRKDVYR